MLPKLTASPTEIPSKFSNWTGGHCLDPRRGSQVCFSYNCTVMLPRELLGGRV